MRRKDRAVTDRAEKCRALTLLMRQQTGQEWTFEKAQADSTAIFRLDASGFTGKRCG